ncbi:5-oxoprolinase subunit C family protein [Dokdonella immobilis]|uniref:Antagonist of KipI n=1 Tax=Dokdonella immobilis TaxID=578942 RepID=A0A1I4XIV1_9GAMM|nr:biotin-dependent carboxyltransferase family protein [Dokdonella immobilis]SFN25801.1 antagonist of KipI [Dokdonella immobilis]
MSIGILAAGLQTTIQDRGRPGYRHLGVGSAGALDPFSSMIANRLVGNADGEAVIEICLTGPTLQLARAARIALCGAQIEATADGREVPGWRRVDLEEGSVLKLGACRRGARAYLAVAGGFDLAPVLGSRSTDLRAGFGGLDGRALAAGDVLAIKAGHHRALNRFEIDRRWIDPAPDLDFNQPAVVRVLAGHDALREPQQLFAGEWQVGAASNRQGLRLQGPCLALADAGERVSEPVMPGTLQLPPDGNPILLLADAQTHGGYPRIAHAIATDLPRLAQLRPGESLRLLPCTRAMAQHLHNDQRQRLARMAIAIDQAPALNELR